MRQLRFVRSADEGNFVIVETPDGQEQFSLLVDAGLRDAARSDLPRLTSRPAEPQPTAVGPREIQIRVRAGESAETIAEQYDIGLDRVLRFAGPVLEERSRIASEARRARARRGTSDGQTAVFGEVVDERFAAHGIDPSAVSWDSRRREDGQWVICAGWHGGEADRTAEWALHLGTRTVTPLDDTAADLLSDRPIRPVITPVQGPVRPSLAAAPPLAAGVVAFPVMPDAHTGPLPSGDEFFDQNAPDLDAPRRPSAPPAAVAAVPTAPAIPASSTAAATRVASATLVDDPALVDEATLPLVLPEPEAPRQPSVKNLGRAAARRAAAEENDEERAARARIPSWDDILLGVRRKGD